MMVLRSRQCLARNGDKQRAPVRISEKAMDKVALYHVPRESGFMFSSPIEAPVLRGLELCVRSIRGQLVSGAYCSQCGDDTHAGGGHHHPQLGQHAHVNDG